MADDEDEYYNTKELW